MAGGGVHEKMAGGVDGPGAAGRAPGLRTAGVDSAWAARPTHTHGVSRESGTLHSSRDRVRKETASAPFLVEVTRVHQ